MASGVEQMLSAFFGLGRKINKVNGQEGKETEEGVVSEKLPELTLDMENDELIKLTTAWHKKWTESKVYAEWQTHADENQNYWLGKHYQRPEAANTRAQVDNVIFESLETWLPQSTQHNPDAMVTLATGVEPSAQNLQYATTVKSKLADISDEIVLRLKLKGGARHWAIYMVGVLKPTWDAKKDMPTVKVIRPKRIILDPDATVDEDGYTGKYIGEHRKEVASDLIDMLDVPGAQADAVKAISDLVENDLGTEVSFIEWWTDNYMCWTLGETVLLKTKNPHWNYDKEAPAPVSPTMVPNIADVSQQPQQPEQQPQIIKGFNHLPSRGKPYILLSVFNLGDQPVDNTSLIGQNLSNQDIINKRVKQIDKNADSQNGGMVVSLERSGLTLQQSKGVTEALRKGGTIGIPTGDVNTAIARMSAPSLPADIFANLNDTRIRLRSIFGVQGFQPVAGGGIKTVRTQMMNNQLDQQRISGGFSEYLEQIADECYNWMLQMLYVYDNEFAELPNKPKLKISVKEGSLLPKDTAAIGSQAIQLATGGKMSTIDLYKKLEYPNPEEMAANVWLELNAPEILFEGDPRVQKAIQMKMQQAAQMAGKPPSESINFKDLPPDGKVQLAAKAGINLHPEGVAAHEELSAQRGKGSTPQDSDNEGEMPPTPQ